MADNIMKLGLILSATDKMSRIIDGAVGKSINKLNAFQKKADVIGKNLQKLGAGTAAAGAALSAGLFAGVENVAQKAKEIQFSSQKIGLSTTEFQKLSYAASKSNMDVSQFETGMGRLAKTMVGASLGQSASLKVMRLAGVSATDASGKLKSIEQVLKELADKFKTASDGPTKTALSMFLFGKAGKDMIPLLNKGGVAIDELGAKFAKSGALIDNEAIEKFKKYRGSIADTKLAIEGMKTQIAIAVLPKIIELATKVKKVVESINDWVQKNKTLVTWFAKSALYLGVWMSIVGTGIVIVGTFSRTIAAFNGIRKAYLFLTKSIWIQDAILNGMILKQSIVTKVAAVNQWLLNSAIGVGLLPIVAIVAGIALLVGVLIYAWKNFAKFRAVILTTWETVKGFGNILKDFVLDRIKGIITGLGSIGNAIGLLFKGKFKEAFTEAKTGVKALSGYDAKLKAVTKTKTLIGGVSANYINILKKEQAAQAANEKPKSIQAIQTAKTNISNSTAKSNSSALNYNPTININSGSAADKESFRKMLSDHKGDLAQMMVEIQNKKNRLAYQ